MFDVIFVDVRRNGNVEKTFDAFPLASRRPVPYTEGFRGSPSPPENWSWILACLGPLATGHVFAIVGVKKAVAERKIIRRVVGSHLSVIRTRRTARSIFRLLRLRARVFLYFFARLNTRAPSPFKRTIVVDVKVVRGLPRSE